MSRTVEWAYAAGWRLVRALPGPVAASLFRSFADRATRRNGAGVRRLRANLARVTPPGADLDTLVRDGMRSYARYWMEAFRLPSTTHEQRLTTFRLDGTERLAAHLDAGEGVVLALPHSGNWDAAGAWVCANGWPLATVAERLRPEGLYQRFLAFRRSLGMEIVPRTGGDRPPLDVLEERLRAGAAVPLLADRDLGRTGVEVDFFGGRSKMPPGCALLTLRTGAPLYTVALWYDEDGPRARIDGPLPIPTGGTLADRVARLTQDIADGLAVGIAEHPADWHMLQPLWLDDLKPAGAAAGTPG